MGFSISRIRHGLDPTKHDLWMFPDRPVRVRSDYGNMTTRPLYSLTYGQVGARR